MNKKRISLIIGMFMIMFFSVSFNSEYNKQVSEYEELYNVTISSLDPENIYSSIMDNNLTLNLGQLDKILERIEKTLPNDKIHDFLLLRTKHDRLKEIIEGGLRWNALGDLDKLSIKIGIDTLKPK
jgi:hypothetical protein